MTERLELRSVAEVLRGSVPSCEAGDDGEERFFGMAEIGRSGQGEDRHVTIDPERRVTRLEAGDVAVVLMGRIGSSTLVGEDAQGAVLGRECVALRSSSASVLPEWLYAWTCSPDFGEQADRFAKGTTMVRLGLRDLLGFTLPVPPRDSQAQLVQMLSRLQSAIHATSRTLVDLEELEVAELTLAFVELQQ